jgi:hypothetical protein
MRLRALMACVFLALAWPALARAQQPFATDDADVTPKGWVHFESFSEYDWLQSGQAPHLEQNTFNMRVNYGFGHGLELDLDSPLIAIFNDATTSPRRPFGIGDTNFGVKYNFREEKAGSKMPALTAAAYVEVPTGNAATGLGSGETDVWLYGVMQKTLAKPVVLRLNGGYLVTGNTSTGVVGIRSAHGHVATMGGSLQRQMTERLSFGGEVSAAVADEVGRGRAQLQGLLGGAYDLTEHFGIDVAVTAGHFIASPRFGIQIGFALDLPRGGSAAQ